MWPSNCLRRGEFEAKINKKAFHPSRKITARLPEGKIQFIYSAADSNTLRPTPFTGGVVQSAPVN
jgi:hypothetical protein